MKLHSLALGLSLGFFSGAHANTEFPADELAGHDALCDKTDKIYYVNGVRNDFFEALASMIALEERLATPLEELEQDVEFKLLYNQTDGIFDFRETFRQKDDEERQKWMDALFRQSEELPYGYTDWLLEQNREMISRASGSELANHIAEYESDITEGSRIVVVSHSQGNLFANAAISSLKSESRKSISNVQIATPAAYIASENGDYLRFEEDKVIAALDLISDVLPANYSTDADLDDSLAHGFVDAYLLDAGASSWILSKVITEMKDLPQPRQEGERGELTVTMSWSGEEPDVDLHVIEPGGKEVYFGDRAGDLGYLDVDDVDYEGPEHYYTYPNKDTEGVFQIFVRNYSQRTSPLVSLNIKTCTDSRNYRLSAPPSGEKVAVPTVKAIKDESGKITYEL